MNLISNVECLAHHGIKGQRWGVRRYQNEDGSRTEVGRRRRSEIASVVKGSLLKIANKEADRGDALRSSHKKSDSRFKKQIKDMLWPLKADAASFAAKESVSIATGSSSLGTIAGKTTKVAFLAYPLMSEGREKVDKILSTARYASRIIS